MYALTEKELLLFEKVLFRYVGRYGSMLHGEYKFAYDTLMKLRQLGFYDLKHDYAYIDAPEDGS